MYIVHRFHCILVLFHHGIFLFARKFVFQYVHTVLKFMLTSAWPLITDSSHQFL